jgi:hypothetical protein
MKTLKLQRLSLNLPSAGETLERVRYYLGQKGVRQIVGYEDLGIAPVLGPGVESMAFLSMYLDESYGEGKPNLVVSGFVSGIDRWAEFAHRWRVEVQEQFRIPYLHMQALMSERSSIYGHLSTQEKVQLFETALVIIEAQADFAVSCSIDPQEHLAITTQDERSFYGSAYTLAVMGCLSAINRHLGDKVAETTLNIYLEDGHRNTGQAIEILQEEWRIQQGPEILGLPTTSVVAAGLPPEALPRPGVRLGTVAPGTKSQMNPLQAADLLAYGVLNFSHPLFKVALSRINATVPILAYHASPEDVRSSLDKHQKGRQMVAEARNQVARVIGTVGGKIRRSPYGPILSLKDVEEEAWQELLRGLEESRKK